MQKIATRLFVYASVAFGFIGIFFVVTSPGDSGSSNLNRILMKAVMICVFIILPTFALSVASKYLNDKK